MKPIVAIVGRPNVGKSTLFNRIVGERISIVEDTPGVTRDRIYADAEWTGKAFTLIDTGGIEPESRDIILSQMRAQAQLAIDSADVIIFIVDVRDGLNAADSDVAQMLLRSKKPVVLAVNKVDSPGEPPMEFYEFYNLGQFDPVAISASAGLGIGDLLDEVVKYFAGIEEPQEEEDVIHVAVIGKPNVGKSSLINHVLGENRVIVSNIPGTTRDAIDSHFTRDGQKYTFIDTAGMRKRGKIEDESIEKYSVIRSLMAVERADVCLLLIDATEGVTEQDTKIAGFAHEKGKGIIIVVNKWDAVEKDDKTMEEYRKQVMEGLAFITYCPILFISAKTGQRVHKLFEMIQIVSNNCSMRITTGMLNDLVSDATARVQPPTDKGRRLKILYCVQAGIKPPTFIFFVNSKKLFHFSYLRYLENRIREAFGFAGVPIKFIVREREKE